MRWSAKTERTGLERMCALLRTEMPFTFCTHEKCSALDEVPLHKTEWRQCRCDHRNAHGKVNVVAWFRHD